MPSPFTLRPALPADMPNLGLMQHACWMHSYKGLLDDSFLAQLSPAGIAGYQGKHFDADGNHASPRMPFIVAESASHPNPIVGFVRGGPTRAKSASGDTVPPAIVANYPFELFGIHVAHDLHRSGVGRALFTQFARAAQSHGEHSIVLWVLSNNTPAIAFYESLGGKPVGSSPLTLGDRSYPQTAYAWENLSAFTGR